MLTLTQKMPQSKAKDSDRLNENHEIEILSGAFMLMRKSALDKVGLLDEDFFMYGEDIDLSYRIMELDYENRYFATSPIIHFKGESTKHSSWSYVKNFHQSMDIFFKKHSVMLGFMAFGFFIQLTLPLKYIDVW